MGRRLKPSLCSQRQDLDHIRRVGEAAARCALTTLFLPQAGTAPCDKVSPEPPIPPVRKTEPTGNNQASLTPTIALWIALQEPLFIPQGLQRNPWGSTPRASNLDRETARLATTRTLVLADQVHTCRAQAVNATSDFAHLQSQVGHAVWWGISVKCTSAQFRASDKEFYC